MRIECMTMVSFQRWTGLLCFLLLCSPSAWGQMKDEGDLDSVRAEGPLAPQAQSPDLQKVADLIVQKTNSFRKEQGLDPVKTNPKLTETAQDFAEYMAENDTYGHTADGRRPAERAKAHGYEYCLVSENIAYQFSSLGFATEELAEKFTQGWIESPGHRENMVDPAATETGVAVAQSEKTGNFYAVQMFGRPESASVRFAVENRSQQVIEYTIGERTFPLPPRYTRTHQRCREIELTFRLSGEPEPKTETITPNDGQKIVITGQADGLELETAELDPQ